MPLFVSDEELSRLSSDALYVAEKAEAYIRGVHADLETVRAQADATAITAEQTCSLLEQTCFPADAWLMSEHDRTVEAYSAINQKLQNSISERANLEKTIQEFKADLTKRERVCNLAEKEIVDLQKLVTVLLKECRDIQLHWGSAVHNEVEDYAIVYSANVNAESDAERVISERLLTFKDISGLVEQNVQLRSLVRNLLDQIQNKESELKEEFEMVLKKHTDDAASKVSVVLERAEEQGRMVESLHTSVAMYKRLYEEEHKLHSSHSRSIDGPPEDQRNDILLVLEGSQEASMRAQEKDYERVRSRGGFDKR